MFFFGSVIASEISFATCTGSRARESLQQGEDGPDYLQLSLVKRKGLFSVPSHRFS